MVDINAIAKSVAERIVAVVDANPADYAEDFDEDALIEASFNYVTEGMPLPGNPENPADWIYEKVAAHPEIDLALSGAKIRVEDWKSDQDLWKHGPMKAYGLKESDF